MGVELIKTVERSLYPRKSRGADLSTEICILHPDPYRHYYCKFAQERAVDFKIKSDSLVNQAYLPLGLAAAMFSTQGVLPFTPNWRRFLYVLIILGILVGASIIALFKGNCWFQEIAKCFPWRLRRVDVQYLSNLILRRGQEVHRGDLEEARQG